MSSEIALCYFCEPASEILNSDFYPGSWIRLTVSVDPGFEEMVAGAGFEPTTFGL